MSPHVRREAGPGAARSGFQDGRWSAPPHHVRRMRHAPPVWLFVPLILLVFGALGVRAWGLVIPILMITVLPALMINSARAVASRGNRSHVMAPPPPAAAPPWQQARARFATVRQEYAAYECDPMAILRMPALADVSVPSTARFVDAFAEAQALDTDARPGREHAAAFVAAVERAERSWQAARDAAERIRHSTLSDDERRSVERAIKLLTTAQESGSEHERLAAYSLARSELARLEKAGVVHLPHSATARLESIRPALPEPGLPAAGLPTVDLPAADTPVVPPRPADAPVRETEAQPE